MAEQFGELVDRACSSLSARVRAAEQRYGDLKTLIELACTGQYEQTKAMLQEMTPRDGSLPDVIARIAIRSRDLTLLELTVGHHPRLLAEELAQDAGGFGFLFRFYAAKGRQRYVDIPSYVWRAISLENANLLAELGFDRPTRYDLRGAALEVQLRFWPEVEHAEDDAEVFGAAELNAISAALEDETLRAAAALQR